jgi:hypothetical protein
LRYSLFSADRLSGRASRIAVRLLAPNRTNALIPAGHRLRPASWEGTLTHTGAPAPAGGQPRCRAVRLVMQWRRDGCRPRAMRMR